jgi:hypothetical protein
MFNSGRYSVVDVVFPPVKERSEGAGFSMLINCTVGTAACRRESTLNSRL